MKSLKNLLGKKNIVRSSGIDEKSVEIVFFGVLKKALPDVGRADIQNFKMKDKKIFLRTVHPAIASEIWRRRENIVNKVNNILGSEVVEEMKIK